jgi:uncharacterized membrane protein YhaH (DUF805 family)
MGTFCAFCGKPIVEGANFCVGCGKPVYQDGAPKPNENVSQLFTEPAPPINTNAYSQTSQQVSNLSVPQAQNIQYAQNQMFQPQYANQVTQMPAGSNQFMNNQARYVPKELTLFGMIFDYFFGGFSGRCRVLELWLTAFIIMFLELIFIGIPCGAAFYYFRTNPSVVQYLQIAIYAINIVFTIINFLPGIMMSTRRLHDLDMSGWMQLVFYIPIIGQLFMLYVMFVPGTNGHNRYG